jgi:hypothetical protein
MVAAKLSAAALGAILVAACASAPSDETVKAISERPARPEQRVADQRRVLPQGQPAASQDTYATPDEAVKALLMACDSKDHKGMDRVFGPAMKDLVSGDPVADQNDFEAFADAIGERAELEERTAGLYVLHVGKDNWSFPIPIVRTKDGRYYFDTVAGETEILARRIGLNELEAISLCRTYVEAQREYAAMDRDGDGVYKYAQRLRSSSGKHDGLYWPKVSDNEPTSPFGPLVADASAEGYEPISGSRENPIPYHGYYFHIIKEQGFNAPGGPYNYVINGNMIAGFALVAYPAEYGKSGIMTFLVSHNGRVFQKDLGAETENIAKAMRTYDPDKSWSLVNNDIAASHADAK